MTKEQNKRIIEIINKEVQRVIENNKNENSDCYKWIYLNLGDGRVIRYNYEISECYSGGKIITWYTTHIYIAEYSTNVNSYVDEGYIDFTTNGYMRLAIEGNSCLRREDSHPPLTLEMSENWSGFTSYFVPPKYEEFFLNYWGKIIELLPNLEYNKGLTESFNNIDEKVIKRINRNQYRKAMKELKASNKEVLPTVKIAVEWWANVIKEFYESNNTIDVKGEEYWENKSAAQIKSENKIKDITEEQLNIFKNTLAKTVMDELEEDPSEEISIEVNEGEIEESLLEDALIASGIPPYFPAGCLDLHTWYVKENDKYLYYDENPLKSYFGRKKNNSTVKSKRKK